MGLVGVGVGWWWERWVGGDNHVQPNLGRGSCGCVGGLIIIFQFKMLNM